MPSISVPLSDVTLGAPQAYENLTLYPLLWEVKTEPDYLLLDEALARGTMRVTEISEAGHVPELRVENESDRPVLLLDGEELVGAKQNRILNLTVLVPAQRTIVIPVSCVEAGRWRAESREFRSAGRAHFATGRAQKSAQVSASLHRRGTRTSDQSAVWAEIAKKSARMRAHSATEAAAALYETHSARLDAFVAAFSPVANQVGAVFVVNGQAVGLDLFDSPATFAAQLPKLVQSYALDALDAAGAVPHVAERESVDWLLQEVEEAGYASFAAVGAGEDLRISTDRVTGGALVVDGRLVHLCAFRLGEGGDGVAPAPEQAMSSPPTGTRGRPRTEGAIADDNEVSPWRAKLAAQAILRAKLVCQTYYSHDPETIERLRRMIDSVAAQAREIAQQRRDEAGSVVVSALAHFLTVLPIGRPTLRHPQDRYRFFADLLFEEYSGGNLDYLGIWPFALSPDFDAQYHQSS